MWMRVEQGLPGLFCLLHYMPITEMMHFAIEKEFIHKTAKYEETGDPSLKSTSLKMEIGNVYSPMQIPWTRL